MCWSRVEHDDRPLDSMGSKDRKHASLIIRCEMEKAIPGEDAIEPFAYRQRPHVGNDPILIWQTLATEREHGGRGINPCHTKVGGGHVDGNGRSGPAAEI